jgi:retron-type reverse transcriptase
LRAATWRPAPLRAAFRRVCSDYLSYPPALAARLTKQFPAPPPFDLLVAFLAQDRGFRKAAPAPPRPAPARPVSLRPPRMHPPPAGLHGLALPPLPTEAALADWLGVSIPHLQWLADTTGRNRHHPAGPLRPYRYRWVPRRGGRPRLLEIPKVRLHTLQRRLLAGLLRLVPPHPAAQGFTPGRSILTNAAVHAGQATLLRFDLTDFFPSITAARVFRLFRTLGYPAPVARLLMGLCTTRLPAAVWQARPGPHDPADFAAGQRLLTRHLPQGAPTSPALANLAAHRLDRRLAGLAARLGARYTRYADDLAFSGDASFARAARRLAPHVAAICRDEGFAVNHRKTRLMRAGGRQHLTGLVVNARPNVPRPAYDRLKAVLTNCVRHGPASQNRDRAPDFRASLAGKIAFVAATHPARGQKLRALFARIPWPAEPDRPPSESP